VKYPDHVVLESKMNGNRTISAEKGCGGMGVCGKKRRHKRDILVSGT
jgi:hypothetical protein